MEYLLLSIFCIFVILIIFCYFLQRKKVKKSNSVEDLKTILHNMNNDIKTKNDAIEFYLTICEMSDGILKLNITKDEFNKLSIDAIKQLNFEAINNLNF